MYSSPPAFILSLVIELVKNMTVMCGILNYKVNRSQKNIIAFFITAAVLITVLYLTDFMNPGSLPCAAIILPCILLTGKRRLIFLFISEISISCIDEIINAVLCKFIECAYSDYYIISNSLTIIIISLLAYFIQGRRKKALDYSLSNINMVYLLMLLLGQIVVLFYICAIHKSDRRGGILLLTTISIVLIVEIVMMYNVSRKNYYYNVSMINQMMLEKQEEYYLKLLDHEDEIRKFRHDIKNHLVCIEALISEHKYDEVTKYLESLKGSFAMKNPEIKTGNTIVSAIVSDYVAKYPEAKLEWNGMIPQELNISNVDICTMFSNVLSNAFENAIKSKKEKNVTVTIETVINNMIITVRNDIGVPVSMNDGILETSKEDKLNHGIGTQNIKRCVESNNGMVEYNFDDSYFEIKIILPNAMRLY